MSEQKAAPKLSFKDMLLKGVEQDEQNQRKGIVSSTPAIGARPGQEPVSVATNPEKAGAVNVSSDKDVAESTKTEQESLEEIEQATVTVHHKPGEPLVHSYVLDAGPLLAQTFSDLQKHASQFYTTPAVLHTEVRDARSRQNIELWKTAGALTVRQPKPQHVNAVTDFAKRTGDFAVLSLNDIHILALARELDVELHGGSDRHLRKGPGEDAVKRQKALENANLKEGVKYNVKVEKVRPGQDEEKKEEGQEKKEEVDDDGWAVVTKKKSKKAYKHQAQPKPEESKEEEIVSKMGSMNVSTSVEEEDEQEDENGWITEDNIVETMRKDQYEPDQSSFLAAVKKNQKPNEEDHSTVSAPKPVSEKFIAAAVSTGDFAMQNIALQMGLNLLSPVDGKHIRQVKSHMLRCHACFHLCPVPRTNEIKEIMTRRQHGATTGDETDNKYVNASLSSSVMGRGFNFCPECGAANTLKRCTVRVDGKNGTIHVYLKRNMQWSTRGNVFQLPATQSKKARRATRTKDPYNFSGSRANGEAPQLILREDQQEYERAIVHDYKLKRHNERVLEDWIGGSIGGGDVSVGNVSVPFAYHRDAARHTGVKIGAGGRIAGSGNQRKR